MAAMPNRMYRYMKFVLTPSGKGKGKYTNEKKDFTLEDFDDLS